jgi:hypothetical protein
MTLEDMFYISQTVAALAIVGSLLFVGMEVRHSNKESRHRTIEETLQNYREVRLAIAGNADVARAWSNGLHDFSALDRVDKERFLLTADLIFNSQQSLYLHYRDGRMPGELYEPQRMRLEDFLRYPGLQVAWESRKNYYHVAFRTIVDESIENARNSGLVPSLYGERLVKGGNELHAS